MFSSLLGGKFSNKCKHAVKCTKLRIVQIRKKKQAMLRFLKKDVADLIAAGHERNAFRRIEALIVEINRTSCYDMIEQFCECILSQLPSLQKQRECPQEAMQAVSTLIFAAARFPDLPELCDLRHLFVERYKGYMESSVNAEFVEKNHKSFSREKRLQVMQNIAEEFSVSWDAAAFDHQSRNATAPKSAHPGNNEASPVETEPKDIHVISTTSDEQSPVPVENAQEDDPCDAVPPYLNPSRNRDGIRTADQLKHGLQGELDSSSEKKEVVSVKPWNVKPDNVAPPYTISNGTNLNEVKNNIEEKNGNSPVKRATYLIPPYVKGKIDDTSNEGDQTIQNIVVAANGKFDNSEGTGRRDEKPKPVSVRRKYRKPPVTETDDSAVDHKKHSDDCEYGEKKTAVRDDSNERTSTTAPTVDRYPSNGKIYPVPAGDTLPSPPEEATSRLPPGYDQLAAKLAAMKKT